MLYTQLIVLSQQNTIWKPAESAETNQPAESAENTWKIPRGGWTRIMWLVYSCTILHFRSSTCYYILQSRLPAADSLCHERETSRGSPTFLTPTRPLTRAWGRPTYNKFPPAWCTCTNVYTYMYGSRSHDLWCMSNFLWKIPVNWRIVILVSRSGTAITQSIKHYLLCPNYPGIQYSPTENKVKLLITLNTILEHK